MASAAGRSAFSNGLPYGSTYFTSALGSANSNNSIVNERFVLPSGVEVEAASSTRTLMSWLKSVTSDALPFIVPSTGQPTLKLKVSSFVIAGVNSFSWLWPSVVFQ